jgi:hypothetical protein
VAARPGRRRSFAELVEPGGVDLVLCHSLLEVVDDPLRVAGPRRLRCGRAVRPA